MGLQGPSPVRTDDEFCASANRLSCFCALRSLWNAADDDTIPDPAAKPRKFQGLHSVGWLWNVGDHTTGEAFR